MNALWTSAEAVAATGGVSARDWVAGGVSIDTRTVQPGDLFVALKDERDGHDFVAEALARGAAAALVSRVPDGVAADAPLLVVNDALTGLRDLGRAGRARFRGKVVAVTGSVGKTGTKEMLRTVLGDQGRVHAAEKSFNNHWGVPLTLARLPKDADFAVIEIGMNHPGEIAPLARLARPQVAIITNVAAVHLAAFADVAAIAREKAAIFAGLEPGGTAVLNRDLATYGILQRRARAACASLARFGSVGRPEYALKLVKLGENSTCIKAAIRGQEILFKIAAPGRHLAMNALAVLAAVAALGGDLGRAALSLASWSPPSGRGTRWKVGLGYAAIDGFITLVDESYNANPASMEAALDVLAATRVEDDVGRVVKGRKIAFLGDMLELGPQEFGLHAGLAGLQAMQEIDLVHSCGSRMQALHQALPSGKRGEWFADSSGLARRTRKLLDAGDVAMVKGSNGAKMSLVVDAILKLGEAQPAEHAGGSD